MTNYRKVIFDASVSIAILEQEKGWEIAKKLLPISIMSSVNVSEIIKYLALENIPLEQIDFLVSQITGEEIALDKEQSKATGLLAIQTKQYGLSLGDRACVSLGISTGLPVFTMDRAWKNLDIPGLIVEILRE